MAATEEPILTNIADMIDLAIGSPENGVVDFNMLQTVLHCIAQQLRITDKNVELRGTVAVMPVAKITSQTIAISEFIIDTEEPGKYEQATGSITSDQESLLVVERIKRSEIPPPKPKEKKSKKSTAGKSAAPPRPSPPASPPSQRKASAPPPQPAQPAPSSISPAQPAPSSMSPEQAEAPMSPAVSTAPSPSFSKEKLSLVTLSKFNVLETAVQDLKERVYGTSPKNETILQEVRSQSNLKAITDMWSNMNVASRLDAAEEAIGKLSSLIQDLIGETTALQKQIDTMPKSLPGAAQSMIAPKDAPSEEVAPSLGAAPSVAVPDLDYLATKDELAQVLSHMQSLRDDLDKVAETFSDALKEVNPKFEPPEPPPRSEIVLAPSQVAPTQPVSRMQQDQVHPAPPGQVQLAQFSRLQERVSVLETELKKCCDGFKKTDGRLKDMMTSFQDQLEYMSKQISDFTTAAEGEKMSPGLIKDLQGLMKLFETVQSMQAQLKEVHETAINLASEKEARQNHIDALLEQIELLKVIKLDREDMVEALADKADLRMLARKVSHDQFENACDDLSKGLEHALGKLNVQESLWQQALDDIQREIEQKLDKIELSPVKDFFNKKLKQLQENLRQMAALRREAEAAGTKKRLLRDVNCISCDANAVMQMGALPPQPPKPLPAHLSMKPYLSYELDAIRKNQANALPQRNLHDWENVQQQMQPSKPQKVRSETDKHLCNRYCGGSHTTTTPAQRVARLGHFMKQWGPEVVPLSSTFAAGDDGRLYKITTTEGANVGPGGAVEGAAVCTPKSPVKKPDTSKSQPRPLEIVAECRCLDPTSGRPGPPP